MYRLIEMVLKQKYIIINLFEGNNQMYLAIAEIMKIYSTIVT